MHQIAFGGRVPPRSAGELTALSQTPQPTKGRGMGRKWREGREGRRGKRKGKGRGEGYLFLWILDTPLP